MRKRQNNRVDEADQDKGDGDRDGEDDAAFAFFNTSGLRCQRDEEATETDPGDDEDDHAGFGWSADGAECFGRVAAQDAADNAENQCDECEGGEEVEEQGLEDVSAGAGGGAADIASGGTVARKRLIGFPVPGRVCKTTYARERSPTHVRMSGERPIALQMMAVVYSPVL